MVTARHLNNAPIREALLDIRVGRTQKVSVSVLEGYHEAVKGRYPTKNMTSKGQLTVQVKAGESHPVVQQSGGPVGYVFKSSDGKQIVQVKQEGFTFNRLRQYEQWTSFRDEARDLWKHYVEVASPESVERIALRYINQINLPLPLANFKEYLLTVPEIAPELPQGLAKFFMRLVIPDPEKDAVANVTQTMEPPSKESLPIILDIDVFKMVKCDARSNQIWDAFEILHDFKNEVFFKSITSKAVEMFK